jgi:2-haloacid dehalogenase
MTEGPRIAVRACVFDAYGTLFDFASATARSQRLPREITTALSALWRDKQLQYTWLRGLQGRHASFWQVTGDALDFALDTLSISDPEVRSELMSLYRSLSAFPDAIDALRVLKALGFGTAVLSNGSADMLADAVASARLGELIDHVLSVDEVGVFKPHPSVYQLACDKLQVPASAISFQSSNAWDAYAASAFGMRVVWCNRYGQRREVLPGAPDREVRSLAELPGLLQLVE